MSGGARSAQRAWRAGASADVTSARTVPVRLHGDKRATGNQPLLAPSDLSANRYLTVPFCPRSRFIIIYCDTVTLITQFISLETLLFLRLASACRRGEAKLRAPRPQAAAGHALHPVSRVTLPTSVTYVQRKFTHLRKCTTAKARCKVEANRIFNPSRFEPRFLGSVERIEML